MSPRGPWFGVRFERWAVEMTDHSTSQELVTVATFASLPEAAAARVALESAGISVFTADSETISMDWMLANAIGWVKLDVPAAEAVRARELIEQARAESHEGILAGEAPAGEFAADDLCLACGGALPKGETRCAACGWTYSEGAAADESAADET